jgi:glycosyltransferase involved in cell wall biosynthesis
MTRPLVSVVIPCYNQGQYLPDAIRSAIAREFPVEVIVVDDGSTDDTPQVVLRFAGITRVRQHNRGLAAARNRGLQASAGAFIIFLDADDRMLPGAIDAAAGALAARPDCAMAYGRCVMMDAGGEILATPEQPVVTSGHHAALLRTNLIWMPAMAIFRRDALVRAGGFAGGFDGAADYDLYLRVARNAPVHDHGQRVATYRRHHASMSTDAARMLRATLAVMHRHRPPAGDPIEMVWREGCRNWQDFYGTQLVEEIRAHLRAREAARAARKTMRLARLAPAVLTREIVKKARLLYAGRAIPAAEISSASRRAEI